ncbi:MAG: YqaJ viral recombinase family protein [Thermoflexaceae bacterium]|nr:YqaJ viral recombinase family protein [Thermoflexaceae bacterium]
MGAKVVVKTKDLSREEWLKYRTGGIGGSDVSIIAGINPFKSVYQLWLEKTGQTEPEEQQSEYAHFGTLLEPIVRKEFMERTGIKVRQKHMLLQSEEFPFMYADVDGVIHENGALCIFEAKTASAYKQDTWEEEVPAPYILQVQHYMAVTGAKKTYIAALVGGNHFYYYEVLRDDEMIAKIVAMEKYFWETYVLGGVEPVPDGSEATTRYFNEKFRKANGETVELPEEALDICREYDRISGEMKKLETEKNATVNQLKSLMKEAEIGTVGERKISWKEVSKSSLDSKKLKIEQPEIYNRYLAQSSYRRFSVA